jgi:hypothetical protein
MTITEFLEARIAEDEAAAELGGWHNGADTFANDNYGCLLVQPARVLAECAAKRAIIEAHRPAVEIVEWFDDATGTGTAPVCPSCRPKDPTDWNPPMGMAGVRPDGFVPSYTLAPCPTLRSLAAVYADHPGYDPAWA